MAWGCVCHTLGRLWWGRLFDQQLQMREAEDQTGVSNQTPHLPAFAFGAYADLGRLAFGLRAWRACISIARALSRMSFNLPHHTHRLQRRVGNARQRQRHRRPKA
jgi:hypothetical protein